MYFVFKYCFYFAFKINSSNITTTYNNSKLLIIYSRAALKVNLLTAAYIRTKDRFFENLALGLQNSDVYSLCYVYRPLTKNSKL